MSSVEQSDLTVAMLREALDGSASVEASGDLGGDVIVTARGMEPITLDMRWAGQGFPRDVDRALRSNTAPGARILLAARDLSSGARRRLAREDIAWVTATGEARIRFPGLVVDRSIGSRRGRDTAVRTDVAWSVGNAAVAETLLCFAVDRQDDALPAVAEIAEVAGVSAGTVSNTTTAFDRVGWTAAGSASRGRSARRVLTDPAALLGAWAAHISGTAMVERYHSPTRDPERRAHELQQALGRRCTIGGRLAAQRIAPFATTVQTVLCHVPRRAPGPELHRALGDIGIEAAPDSNRVQLVAADAPTFHFAVARDGLSFAHPVRVYADLLAIGGRGEDEAEHLRTVSLGF